MKIVAKFNPKMQFNPYQKDKLHRAQKGKLQPTANSKYDNDHFNYSEPQ